MGRVIKKFIERQAKSQMDFFDSDPPIVASTDANNA